MNYDQFLHYLSMPLLWNGLLIAMEIAVASFFLSLPFALVVALMRMSENPLVRAIPGPYIWVMRGTPVLLQLLFWYNVLPSLGLRVSALATAIIGLTLNEVAFMAEILRGGLQSVKNTQRDAAAALGLNAWQVLWRIVLPQAMKSIAPSMSNEAIIIIKNTSLASVITVGELTLVSEQVVSTNFQYVEVFVAAGVLYLLATSVVSVIQNHFETRLSIEKRGRAADSQVRKDSESVSGPSSVEQGIGAEGHMSVSGQPTTEGDEDSLAFFTKNEPLPLESSTNAAPENFVEISNVRKAFQGNLILRGVSLKIKRGEVVFLIGPSGSGKTTLLRTINRLETIDGGEIKVGGRYIGYRSTSNGLAPTREVARDRAEVGVGMVFQHFNLFEHLTVIENIVEAPLRVYGRSSEQAYKEARALLRWAGLGGYENHYPHQLSGGQQQRIAIIRAVATHPSLILFDEPTSALDPELVNEVLALMRKLAKAGMTMIVVSHEIVFARDWADRVVFMEDGQIVEQGEPKTVFSNPKSARTRNFIKSIEDRSGGNTFSVEAEVMA